MDCYGLCLYSAAPPGSPILSGLWEKFASFVCALLPVAQREGARNLASGASSDMNGVSEWNEFAA